MKRIIYLIPIILYSNHLFSQNLVVNGDFEQGSAGWSGGVITQDNPHSGKNCLLVSDRSTNSNVAASTGLIDISQSDYYRLTVWHRADVEGRKILIAINQYDSSNKWISGNNIDMAVSSSIQWKRHQVIIKTFHPNTAKIRIILYATLWTKGGELTGDAYFDDVVFERISLSQITYGSYLLNNQDISIWHSPVTQKVYEDMYPEESNKTTKIRFYAARNEYEMFQIVLTPKSDINLLNLSISDLLSENGVIPKESVVIKMAEYVNITTPTDIASTKGPTPDPLINPIFPRGIKAGKSLPFYFILKVPPNAAAGEYNANIKIDIGNQSYEVPVTLTVWDFDIPLKHSIRTAYGLSTRILDYYHNLKGDYDALKQVVDLYLRNMSEHRISPYNPFFDDNFSVNVSATGWVGGKITTDGISQNHYMEVNDSSNSECTNAYTFKKITLEGNTDYNLSWRAKGAQNHDYLVSVKQYDADGKWISGANIDFVRTATGDWSNENVVIQKEKFKSNAMYITVRLFGRRWTSGCELTGTTYFDDITLKKSDSDENLIFNGDFEADIKDALVDVDFSRFDKRAQYLFDVLNFDGFVFPLYHFAGGDWRGQYTDVDILGYKWGTKEYEDLFIRITQATTRHLRDKGYLKYAYTYWYDEPSPDDYELVRYGMELIHRADPELKRLLTEQVEPELIGYVDIWSPVLYKYDPVLSYERQKLGEEVWWYVCTGPRSPYPNNFIDHPAIEHRILFWMNWKYQVTGSLYWSINYWDDCIEDNGYQNPYADPQSYVCGDNAHTWGNGDGRLIYPPYNYTDGQKRIEGPTTSIRWELIRDGVEDYEYFYLLRSLTTQAKDKGIDLQIVEDAEKLLNIPSEIVDSTTSYTTDPTELEDYRILLGNTIENLVHLLNSGSNDAGYTDTSDAVNYDFIDYDTTQDVSDVLIDAIASDDGYSGLKDGFSQDDLYWEDTNNEEAGVDAGMDGGNKDTSVAIDAVHISDTTGGGGEESSGCSCSLIQN
jgi:hypothetical protein